MKVTYVGERKVPRYTIEIGDKFGKLTVRELAGIDDRYRQYYLCDCECGNQVIIFKSDLVHGAVSSCGCYTAEPTFITHRTQRKYENKCSHCGATPHYAKGLCHNCYARFKRNGTLDYKPKREKETREMRIKKRQYLANTLTPKNEQEAKILDYIKENKTYEEIGKILGVSRQRVGQIVINMNKREMLKEPKDEV